MDIQGTGCRNVLLGIHGICAFVKVALLLFLCAYKGVAEEKTIKEDK
jgi:hypothetical protein